MNNWKIWSKSVVKNNKNIYIFGGQLIFNEKKKEFWSSLYQSLFVGKSHKKNFFFVVY